MRQIGHGAARRIKARYVDRALLAVNFDQAVSVRRPDGTVSAERSRSCVVSERRFADIEIKLLGQIPRLCVWRKIDKPQVRLGGRIYRLRFGRDKRDLVPVRTKRRIADVHIEGVELRRLTAIWADRVELGLRKRVVRFIDVK